MDSNEVLKKGSEDKYENDVSCKNADLAVVSHKTIDIYDVRNQEQSKIILMKLFRVRHDFAETNRWNII